VLVHVGCCMRQEEVGKLGEILKGGIYILPTVLSIAEGHILSHIRLPTAAPRPALENILWSTN